MGAPMGLVKVTGRVGVRRGAVSKHGEEDVGSSSGEAEAERDLRDIMELICT